MRAYKFWLDKIHPDSSDSDTPLCDISWTSSESEKEHHETPRKMIKLSRTDSNSWIKPLISQNNRIPTEEHLLDYLDESPIISNLEVEEMSPVLVETHNTANPLEMSPVIGNRHRLKKVCSKYQKKCKARQKVLVTPESSPDLFESKATQVIESESPEPIEKDTIFCISQSSDFQASSSQSNSQMMPDSSIGDSPKINSSSLYHQPALRRKKRYKRGGLASQLQKTLQLQRSRISIWQHELFTKKTASIELNGKIEILDFVVESIHREYGSTLLECKISELNDSECLCNCEENKMEPFFILVGNLLNITFSEGNKYKMFSPFHIKTVSHKSRQVKCYFGVNKITNSKQ